MKMEQRWRSGESARLPPMWPGFKSRLRLHMWVELLVLSVAPRGFSPGTPVFPSPQKPTFPNSNSTRNQVDEEPLCGCANLQIAIHLFLFCLAPRGEKCFNLFLTTNTAAVTSPSNQQYEVILHG